MRVKAYRKKGTPWLPCHHSKPTLQPSTEALDSTLFAIPVNCPGGPVIKSPPANAGDTGSIPGLGRVHMPWGNSTCTTWLLSPWATTTEVHAPSSPCSATREATVMRSPHTATRVASACCNYRKPTRSNEGPVQAKIINTFKKKICLAMQGTQVQSLIRELRLHMLQNK